MKLTSRPAYNKPQHRKIELGLRGRRALRDPGSGGRGEATEVGKDREGGRGGGEGREGEGIV